MNSVGLIGSLLLTFSAVPELIRTVKDGKCHMGWGFLSMWFVGEIFCTFYGFDLKEIPLMVNYTFNLGVAGLMVYYKLKEFNLSFLKIKKYTGVAEWLRQQSPKLYGRKS